MKPALTIAVLLGAFLVSPAFAQSIPPKPAASPAIAVSGATSETTSDATASDLVEVHDDGLTIDWTRLTMQVTGIGMAPDRGSLSASRLMAKRTAYSDAYHQLADDLDNIRVNSEAYVRDLTAVDDSAREDVNDLIQDARSSDLHFWPDGSAQISLKIPLAGDPSLSKVLLGTCAATSSPFPGSPSGILLDARGTGAQPALIPHVRDALGQVLTPDNQPFRYYHLPAGTTEFVGDEPLKLVVYRAFGTTHADLLLKKSDADKFKAALKAHPQLPIAILL